MFSAITIAAMHRPAEIEVSGLVVIAAWPSAMMLPQVGVGGLTPSPRKLKPASARIAEAALSVATTITGGSAFGITWRSRMRVVVRPIECDASMYGRGRIVSATDRMTEATRGV